LLKIKQENLKKIQNICIECHDFLETDNKNFRTYHPLLNFLKENGFKTFENYKKSEKHPHLNFYIYATQEFNQKNDNFFFLRNKNDYVSFNKILRNKLR